MRLCVVSDCHIDTITTGVERSQDIESCVIDSVNACIDNDCDIWLNLGDWADPDNKRSFYSAMKAVEIAKTLKELGIESIWLTGNHDILEDGKGTSTLSPLKASGLGLVVDTPRVIDRETVQFVCLPYSSRANAYDPELFIEEAAKLLVPDKKLTIVIGHLDIEGITPGSEILEMPRGREVFWPTKAIRKHMPHALCLSGHIHRHQTYISNGIEIQVIGSLSRLSFSEEDSEPGFMIDDEFVPVNAPEFLTIVPNTDYTVPTQTPFFVRFAPGATETDGMTQTLKESLELRGGIVKILPRETAEAVVAKATEAKTQATNPRKVVLSLIEESNSSDKPGLKEICSGIMDENPL